LIGKPVTRLQSVQSALDEHRARKRLPAKDRPPLLPDETARVMREFFDRHYRRCVINIIRKLAYLAPKESEQVRTAETLWTKTGLKRCPGQPFGLQDELKS
jgi:hypothetical protein